jgi:hypothetical protein
MRLRIVRRRTANPDLFFRVQNVVHLLRYEGERLRIQRVMLAAPRAEAIRDSEKVLFIDLIEDGSHGVLDELIFQGKNGGLG